MQHPPPSASFDADTPALRVDPEAVTWALARLRPPSKHDLRLAHRVGINPNDLIEAFTKQYLAAIAEDRATIAAIVGEHDAGPHYCELWDHLNAIAEDRRQEWWEDPQLAVAEILNPAITADERGQLATMLRSTMVVGHVVTFDRRRRAARSVASAGRARPRRLRSTVRRRTSASSSSSSQDPGSDSDQPAPAPLPALALGAANRVAMSWLLAGADVLAAEERS